jgi:hypothetical protein
MSTVCGAAGDRIDQPQRDRGMRRGGRFQNWPGPVQCCRIWQKVDSTAATSDLTWRARFLLQRLQQLGIAISLRAAPDCNVT